jgi:hypothetical protein
MATSTEVRDYLAHWCQLGKGVVMPASSEVLRPQPVLQGDRYSPVFEHCWQQIMACEGQDCYLEGTNQTIAELLSNRWDVVQCARCAMPVPSSYGFTSGPCCPCQDLPSWPNFEIPQPRSPITLQTQLQTLHQRLGQAGHRYAEPKAPKAD